MWHKLFKEYLTKLQIIYIDFSFVFVYRNFNLWSDIINTMKNNQNIIYIKGAKENNLKNIDLKIPKNKLIVFTGVSGSGKSSLAFNTIYEEGKRRYVDSLSSYARQFLGNTQKPLVDSIEGLSPAISIEQKTTHNNPRSTVGTVTEIYDYLRLLYARLGKPYCPKHKKPIDAQKTKDIINKIFLNPKNSKIIISSPVVKNEKGSHQNLFDKLRKDGFLRVNVNNNLLSLDDKISLDKNKKHNIEIIVDRIILKELEKSRVSEAVELALEYGKGLVSVEVVGKSKDTFSKFYSCSYGDFNMQTLEPRLFSFNSPVGMCEGCKGLGLKLSADIKKIIPNLDLSINQGGIKYFKNIIDSENLEWQEFNQLLRYYDINKDMPIKKLSKKEIKIIFNGSNSIIEYSLLSSSGNKYERHDFIEGIGKKIERKHFGSSSEQIRMWYRNTFMSDVKCNTCNGKRLNDYALAVKINDLDIYQFTKMSVEVALSTVYNLVLDENKIDVAELILNELTSRLTFLNDVGLEYLTLDRKAETLSGGESQRIRLATQIGSNLSGVLYVLDEPSIGLHQKDNHKLIKTLKSMVDIGNTLIVVEHDEDTIKHSDFIVDIGKMAGEKGGNIIFADKISNIEKAKNSITADFILKRKTIDMPKSRRSGNGKILEVIEACENNLQKINVKFPLGKFVAVTGVSGSGKSTLVKEVLSKSIQQKISNPFIVPGKHKELKGIMNIDKLVLIDQSPIGRTPRSNTATYTSVFDDIRDLFANTQLARARGFLKGRFSFNVDGGRCDKCLGDGVIKIEMHFLPDVYVKCDHCEGKRYNNETLEIKYHGKSIFEILNMSAEKALDFFANNKKISHKLKTVYDVGLGYIKLGQPATTLSGGEAQRVKLATFLQKKPTGKTIYILDEPTTGLHQYDVKKLIKVLNKIVDGGDTIIIIEHNLDVIKMADYIIDLGPGGGVKGGKIIATGTPEQVLKVKASATGEFLKKIIK